MSREGGLGPPLIYAIIGVVIGSIGNYLTQMMMPFGSFGRYGGGFFFSIIILPCMVVICLFIAAAIMHALFMLVAGRRTPFAATFRLIGYPVGSTSPINVSPFVGGLISGVWGLLRLVLGGAEAHEVPQAKAAIVVLLPAVICCGLGVLFGGAMLALIFGAAAAG